MGPLSNNQGSSGSIQSYEDFDHSFECDDPFESTPLREEESKEQKEGKTQAKINLNIIRNQLILKNLVDSDDDNNDDDDDEEEESLEHTDAFGLLLSSNSNNTRINMTSYNQIY